MKSKGRGPAEGHTRWLILGAALVTLAWCLLVFIPLAAAAIPAGAATTGTPQPHAPGGLVTNTATITPTMTSTRRPTNTPTATDQPNDVFPTDTNTPRPPPTATRQYTNTPKPWPTATATPPGGGLPPTATLSPSPSPLPQAVVSSPTGFVPRSSITPPVATPVPPTSLPPTATPLPPTATPSATSTTIPSPTPTLTPSTTPTPAVFVAAPPSVTVRVRATSTQTPDSGPGGSRIFLALGGVAIGIGGILGVVAILLFRGRLR